MTLPLLSHICTPNLLASTLIACTAPYPNAQRPQEEIYSSSYAAAAYLESINFDKKVRGGCTGWLPGWA